MTIRIFRVAVRVCLAGALICAAPGCASPSNQAEDDATTKPSETAAAATAAARGPFDAAHTWATEFDAAKAPPAVRDTVHGWKTARVARVWSVDEAYRAVIVRKSTGREAPAVLLEIARDDGGVWQVTGAEPTTSTHLWSEL